MSKFFQQPSSVDAQAHFSSVPKAEIPRSRFDRSCGHKSTYDAGNLIPVFCDEVLPGDTFKIKALVLSRLATPLKPVMDNLYQDIHFFFVPARLVWDHWVNFMGERENPDDDPADYSIPQNNWNPSEALTHADGGAFAVGDYLGLPKFADNHNHQVNALILRAIILIWNSWYRDQNLQDPLPLTKGDSGDALDYNMPVSSLPRGKRKDYFTSALPWPQKGDAVLIPLGDQAPLVGFPSGAYIDNSLSIQTVRRQTDNANLGSPTVHSDIDSSGLFQMGTTVPPSPTPGQDIPVRFTGGYDFPNVSAAYADLTSASAMTINALRTAFQLQRMLERDARSGTRYIELIWSHFGVTSPDFRLQRPEFLGSGSGRVNLSPIAATFTSSGNAPQGNLSAVGTGTVEAGFDYSATEHGYIIGFLSARADLTYQRGLHRMWSREIREDFYFPALAHLGEQAILNKELWLAPAAANTNDAVFGYQERFGEYRYKQSQITGLFASEESASLDVWHWSQDFTSLPALNEEFIIENPPIDRTIAVASQPHFIFDAWFNVQCDRPMPVYSVPGLIDHL